MTENVLVDPTPFNPQYLPSEFIDREDEKAVLKSNFTDVSNGFQANLHLHGPRGTGKTHLTLSVLKELPNDVTTCYIPGTVYDTQYKALQQVYAQITGEDVKNGYHTSELQRRIKEKTHATQTVVVLDEVDFLLMNDGDDLLYYLSRLKTQNFSIITVSSHYHDLEDQLEERTYSTLQPQRVGFEHYTAQQIYDILLQRARKALKPRSLQRSALTYIASTTANTKIALTWLKYSAKKTKNAITESLIKESKNSAYMSYVNQALDDFSEHHFLLYEAINQLTEEGNQEVQTGEIYSKYKELCQTTDQKPLSDRRISDYLKHLELLDLITAEYHYGGQRGKTRDIKMNNGVQ